MVYYRKYRPQTIDELDNEDVRATLTRVLSSNEPPHAFLFTGPKGLGKTSSARIVAKALNCEKIAERKEKNTKHKSKDSIPFEPCNECEMCVSITNGNNLDVMEIDAASNRGIDEIRDLREKIRLSPVSARKKVYIIDEVHMLTSEAFNALLKTLEEPPEHAVFILATTEQQKVPATILSRCLHISFHKATQEELLRSFKRIVDGEKLSVDDEALVEIARLSDGGFRDGAKILEELALRGEKITLAVVEKQYHSVSNTQQIESLLGFLAKNDLKGSIELLSVLATDGTDMRFFLEQLLGAVHVLLLASVGVGEKSRLTFTLSQLRLLSELLQKAHAETRNAVVPSLPLELAIITYLSGAEEAVSVPQKKAVTLKNDADLDLQVLRKKVGDLERQRAITGEKEKEPEPAVPEAANGDLMAYKAEGELTREWLETFWQTFIIKVKDHNHTISGVLRGCRLRSFDRKNMVIETAYKFHKDRLGEARTLEALAVTATTLAGNPVTVTIELKSGK